MEEALNQEELKQELPSEEDQSSGILPTKLTQEQEGHQNLNQKLQKDWGKS